jgi:hypothetical protein
VRTVDDEDRSVDDGNALFALVPLWVRAGARRRRLFVLVVGVGHCDAGAELMVGDEQGPFVNANDRTDTGVVDETLHGSEVPLTEYFGGLGKSVSFRGLSKRNLHCLKYSPNHRFRRRWLGRLLLPLRDQLVLAKLCSQLADVHRMHRTLENVVEGGFDLMLAAGVHSGIGGIRPGVLLRLTRGGEFDRVSVNKVGDLVGDVLRQPVK